MYWAERLVERQVLVEAPAMTDKDGNIIPFDSEGVTQPNRDAGLWNRIIK